MPKRSQQTHISADKPSKALFDQLRTTTKSKHAAVDRHAFMTRYTGNNNQGRSLTLMDHYVHLAQLKPIYEAMERALERFKSHRFVKGLMTESLEPLKQRSQRISHDLGYLNQHIQWPKQSMKASLDQTASQFTTVNSQTNDDQWRVEATSHYVNYLDSLGTKTGCTDQQAVELLAHFSVRILGDMFGGQKIKKTVEALYQAQNIALNPNEATGRAFYDFSTDDQVSKVEKKPATLTLLKQYRKHLNALPKLSVQPMSQQAQNAFCESANNAFTYHDRVFDQIEAFRSKNVHLFDNTSEPVHRGEVIIPQANKQQKRTLDTKTYNENKDPNPPILTPSDIANKLGDANESKMANATVNKQPASHWSDYCRKSLTFFALGAGAALTAGVSLYQAYSEDSEACQPSGPN